MKKKKYPSAFSAVRNLLLCLRFHPISCYTDYIKKEVNLSDETSF